MEVQPFESINFDFLKEHDPMFLQLATIAERIFVFDPNSTLIKLRQLAEALAQDLAVRCGITVDITTKQVDLIYRLDRELQFGPDVRNLFHTLRKEGNRAVHEEFVTSHAEAMNAMRMARQLAVWYHRVFGAEGTSFKPSPFRKIPDPSEHLRMQREEVKKFKAQLQEANEDLSKNQELAELAASEKAEQEALLEKMREEAGIYESLLLENEQKLKKLEKDYEDKLKALQAQIGQKGAKVEAGEKVRNATQKLQLTEAETRILIDQQLRDAGWEVDTEKFTYNKGTRPEKGKNLAIAEWPTIGRQHADYILFAELTPVAAVEAKRENKDVSGKIGQAERYAYGFQLLTDSNPAWTLEGKEDPWSDGLDNCFKLPFVYSCNGRGFVRELAEKSGTWFRDLRKPSNTKRPLENFHTPEGLMDRLERDRKLAEESLKQEGFTYLSLRDYQEDAIRRVEEELEKGKTECLLAMATGTGKTRTIIGLMYRLIKAERFKRILFLVDRNTLGVQAQEAFDEATLERGLPLSKHFNIAELGDMAADAAERIQVATVQSMVLRTFQSDNPPPIDAYDCIIIDEAHRGYTLDQEMTEGELEFRDQAQYRSAYRRVLDYFDAIRIGMTATPAAHTTEIFGKPVYQYSYREAVAADWLIDHEPPIRYETALSKNGIKFEKGEEVQIVNTGTGQVDTAQLPDDMNFDVAAFNRRVITEPFNRVICDELVKEFDFSSEEKMLIFCATDAHCDMVKRLLDEAFFEMWGSDYNEAAVRKITGQSDRVDQLIRHYKKEQYPSIAITVDLLTTGVDVPSICHLVFLRRVTSRVLYEQMIGRATRRCDKIGKTVFKIYDPVDLYATLEEVSTMKPLVKDPNITLAQLIGELQDPATHAPLKGNPDRSHAEDVLDEIAQKVMRILRKAEKKAEDRPGIRKKLDELEKSIGVPPGKLHTYLQELKPQGAADFLRKHTHLLTQLDEVKRLVGTELYPVISGHEDKLINREQNYGSYGKPEDYLDGFATYIRENINEVAALSVVVSRPRDLTRNDLKQVRLILNGVGFNEAGLNSAWRNQTNKDIAAGIIGYIRQAALGEALIPFKERVERGMEKVMTLHAWNPAQKSWLNRLAKQLVHEAVIDREFVNTAFVNDGGAALLDKRLGKHLDEVMETLANELWQEQA